MQITYKTHLIKQLPNGKYRAYRKVMWLVGDFASAKEAREALDSDMPGELIRGPEIKNPGFGPSLKPRKRNMSAQQIIETICASLGQKKEVEGRDWVEIEKHFHFRMTDEEKSILGTPYELKKAAEMIADGAHAQFIAGLG